MQAKPQKHARKPLGLGLAGVVLQLEGAEERVQRGGHYRTPEYSGFRVDGTILQLGGLYGPPSKRP